MSNIQEIQDAFDQAWPIVGYYDLFTQKPLTPSDIGNCLICPQHYHWISGLIVQYDNNNLKNTFIVPLPIEYVPA